MDDTRTTIEERLAALERRVEEQQRVIESYRQRDAAIAGTPTDPIDRRSLLRWASAAAVGTVAAGTAFVATQQPAAAANGDPLLLGVAGQTATSPTSVSFGDGVGTGLELTGSNSGGFPSSGAVVHLLPKAGMPTGVKIEAADLGLQLTTGVDATAGVPIWGHGGFAGVIGEGNTGVIAQSQDGPGLVALTTNGSAVHLHRNSGGTQPTSRVNHTAGDLDTDNTNLWWCVANSAVGATDPDPTHWRKVAGPDTAGALHVRPSPIRIYDSRPNDPPAIGPKTPLAAGSSRIIDADGDSGPLPTGTTAVLLNIAVTDTTGTGYLGAFKGGDAWPGTVNVNWDHPNATVSNFAIVPVDANNAFTIFAGGNGTVDVVVDLLGYCR